ncbi:hypothetical protein BN938_0842 [Mucinivorans hirudinis]|uniref:Lipoprotein n=1 Tax=Mucinivorans hirudinis TaxID=1433126 RepID=A0A060RAZ4_9BACT|nr:hypothetical protein BN938_0842 [Mucinivorans hirudinis]
MKTLKLISFLLVLSATFVFTSCKKKEELPPRIETAAQIAELHNILLQKIYTEYLPEVRTKSKNQNDLIIADVIDFIAAQPQLGDVDKTIILEIKNFFTNFDSRKVTGKTTAEALVEYILQNCDATKVATNSNIESLELADLSAFQRDVYNSVIAASTDFWTTSEFTNSKDITKSKGSATILADGVGAAWGLFLGPGGSAIAATIASLVANEAENGDGSSPVFDGKVYTPKDM